MTDVTGKQEIKFLLETDNGSNDTYVHSYELYYIGDIPETPTAKPTAAPTAKPTVAPTAGPQLVSSGECSTMTHGGQYAGPSNKLGFSAMALYGNGDYCSTSYTFTGTNKKYRMVVKGASDNSSTAGVSVYIGGKK